MKTSHRCSYIGTYSCTHISTYWGTHIDTIQSAYIGFHNGAHMCTYDTIYPILKNIHQENRIKKVRKIE